jgi:post-segregation antitoxin (ccd killing protein)
MTPNPPESQRTARLNITVKPATYARLQEARTKRGLEINVSQVADAAINSELDRLDKPGIADVIARLRVESDLRRGEPYRQGHPEGVIWARKVASWAEICRYALTFTERDVRVGEGDMVTNGYNHHGLYFAGKFEAPGDYGQAPPGYVPKDGDEVSELDKCEQFWRGWLAGVKEIFEAVKKDLAPIELEPEPESPAPDTELDVAAVGDVDPDEIPF